MKNFKIILSILITTILFVNSCKKSSDDSKPAISDFKNSIAKKWIIQNKKSTLSAEYLWFEFTLDNKYIIEKADHTFLSGSYTISNDSKTITLIDYGVMTINTLSDSEFAFTIILNNSTTGTTLTSTPATIISTSSKTALLCRNWNLDKFVDKDTTMTFPSSDLIKLEVVFSKYGTYFVRAEYHGGGTNTIEYINNIWKWKDASETYICWGEIVCDCIGKNETQIKELTTASLVVVEIGESGSQTTYLSPVLVK